MDVGDGKQRSLWVSQQTAYVPIPAYYLERERDDPINLADYIRVLWRRRFLILLGTLACALTAFVVSMMIPPVYQTRATLILQPSQFSTELKPAPLSVTFASRLLSLLFCLLSAVCVCAQSSALGPAFSRISVKKPAALGNFFQKQGAV